MDRWQADSTVDRLDDVRGDPDQVAALWPAAGVLAIDARGHVPVRSGDPLALELVPSSEVGQYDPDRDLLLGRTEQPVFARPTEQVTGLTFRDAAARLSVADAELAAIATALNAWHHNEPYCPGCGRATTLIRAGAARRCPTCNIELFPRTDPAIIVAITDPADRLLLARQGSWPSGRYSVLAGFVEAGESLEQTVHREVFEEVGLRLDKVSYVASQPWPFPRSLMLGFTALAATTDITIDGVEIAAASWFRRDELRAAIDTGEVSLPGPASIGFRLITSWLAGE